MESIKAIFVFFSLVLLFFLGWGMVKYLDSGVLAESSEPLPEEDLSMMEEEFNKLSVIPGTPNYEYFKK